MRKLTLVTAIVLVSTSAFAGGSRGLSSSSWTQAPVPPPPVAAPPPQIVAPQPQMVQPEAPARRAEVTVLPAPVEQPAVTAPSNNAPQSVEDKLKAAGELRQDGSVSRAPQAQVQAPVQPAPAQTQARMVPAQAQATAPTAPSAATPPRRMAHAKKPVRQHVAHRRESTEHKVRRIAARFGIYW